MKITKLLLGALAFVAIGTSCDSSSQKGEKPEPGDGTIYITANTNAIIADGKDALQFVVMQGEVDVTASSTIRIDGQTAPLAGHSFSTSTAGNYVFYAVNGVEISPKVTVSAVAEMPALPTDSKPAQFDNFAQRVTIVKITGTGCQYCPLGMASFHDIENKAEHSAYVSKYNLIEAHAYNSNDPMYSKDSYNLAGACASAGSAPNVCYNLRTSTTEGFFAAIAPNIANIKKAIDKQLDLYPAKAGIAASAKLVGDRVIVTAGVKISAAGNYKVGAWLLEDGISAKQTNSTGLTGYDFNTHNNAIRPSNIITQAAAQGELLAFSGKAAANSEHKMVFSLPWNANFKAENCNVVVFVSTQDDDGASTKYYINNSTVCKLGATKAYEYK